MFKGLRTVVYFVDDVSKAKDWYRTILGIDPYFDEPFYTGFNVGGYELGLHPNDPDRATSEGESMTYWGVDNIDEAMKRLQSSGATPHGKVEDVGGGIRLGAVKDPFGNVVGIIENPHFTVGQ